jgi:thiol-disulfide isomerase/thioredoxin
MRFLLALTIFLQTATPQPAPALSLKDARGRAVRLSDYRGKVALVNFWATWCAPCLAEMPELEKLQQEYKESGLQIVGVSYPGDKAHDVIKAQQRLGVSYPILLGDEETLARFQISDVLPVTVIVDRNGNITDRILGILEPDEFAARVRPLLDRAGFNAGEAKQESPQPAAEFKLPDLDGQQISSADLRGSVVVLDFWATWCGPCLAELPTFNSLHAKYAGRGVKVIGIAVQSGWAEDIKPYRDKYKVAYSTLIGDDEVVEKYGVIGFPTTYILDKEFKVHKKFTGKLPERKELEREIESLLAANPGEQQPKKGTR